MASVGPMIASSPTKLARLVNTIGDEDFGSQLLAYFFELCGADYCTVFTLSPDAARSVTTASLSLDAAGLAQQQIALYIQDQRWQRDPMIAQARKQLDLQPVSLVHTVVSDLPAVDYRDVLYNRANVCDRVLLCARSATGLIGLSLLRASSSGTYSTDDIVHVQDSCPLLMAIIDKHVDLTAQKPNFSEALTSLKQIETCLASSPVALSQRESEVCARVLYGISSLGIGLDLGIGEETVMTYRKRAYQRLGIGSQRELVVWYLDLWGALHLRGRRRIN